jgi:pimeloyl-ACP methyl ester carboxylesterase
MPYADNHGTRIHYDLEGQGPDLILVPGFAGTLEDWREFGYTPTLGKHNRLVLIDPRGRGASDRPHDPGPYAMKHMVNDLVAVLDDLKVEKAHYFTLKGLGHLEAYAHSDMVLPMVCQFLDRVGRH